MWSTVTNRLAAASGHQTGCAAGCFCYMFGLLCSGRLRTSCCGERELFFIAISPAAVAQVVICHNHLSSQEEVSHALTHELVHAYDHCRSRDLDWNNCEHHACSEARSHFAVLSARLQVTTANRALL